MNKTATICMTAVEKNSPETRKYKMGKQNVGVEKNSNTTKKPLTDEMCVCMRAIHHSATFHLKRICEHVPRTIQIEIEIERTCVCFQCAILK